MEIVITCEIFKIFSTESVTYKTCPRSHSTTIINPPVASVIRFLKSSSDIKLGLWFVSFEGSAEPGESVNITNKAGPFLEIVCGGGHEQILLTRNCQFKNAGGSERHPLEQSLQSNSVSRSALTLGYNLIHRYGLQHVLLYHCLFQKFPK